MEVTWEDLLLLLLLHEACWSILLWKSRAQPNGFLFQCARNTFCGSLVSVCGLGSGCGARKWGRRCIFVVIGISRRFSYW